MVSVWLDQSREFLGSHLRITFSCSDSSAGARLLEQCWSEIEKFHLKYSRFLTGNVLEQINAHLGVWQKVDDETFSHLRVIETLQRRYPLHFSLAVKKALEKIGYDSTYTFRPIDDVSAGDTLENPPAGSVILRDPCDLFIADPIELGGFGKGYALDLCAGILRDTCPDVCLDFGGDLYAQGRNPSGEPWKMVLESPLVLGEAIGSVILDGLFLTASGTLRRRWGSSGELHHLIDPHRGRPADYWAGTFVLANSGLKADFLATGLFCTDTASLDRCADQLADTHFLLVGKDGSAQNHDFSCELF